MNTVSLQRRQVRQFIPQPVSLLGHQEVQHPRQRLAVEAAESRRLGKEPPLSASTEDAIAPMRDCKGAQRR
jgi:hypothetical protein